MLFFCLRYGILFENALDMYTSFVPIALPTFDPVSEAHASVLIC